MSRKPFNWTGGVLLEDHTRKKHSILRAYFSEYLKTRCQNRMQELFRLVVVDGFAGGGLYQCGTPGSPIIFIQCLVEAVTAVNAQRMAEGFKPIRIDCLILLNELDPDGLALLQSNIMPYEELAKGTVGLNIKVEYFGQKFDTAYPEIKKRIVSARARNVFFNLDQSGYSQATETHVRDIMTSWPRPEVLLTFMVSTLLTYISQNEHKSRVPLEPKLRSEIRAIQRDEGLMAQPEFMGVVEKLAFESLKGCAPYVSPFSIGNPTGWHYWLMHFANVPRARQVYNDILHLDGNAQGHYGRSGLKMLAYDPAEHTGQLYLFDHAARKQAKEDLYYDIPRLVSEEGDAMLVSRFYEVAYSETPAHSDDIHQSMMDNPDIVIVTSNGGTRREARAIRPEDTIKIKAQRSLIFML